MTSFLQMQYCCSCPQMQLSVPQSCFRRCCLTDRRFLTDLYRLPASVLRSHPSVLMQMRRSLPDLHPHCRILLSLLPWLCASLYQSVPRSLPFYTLLLFRSNFTTITC